LQYTIIKPKRLRKVECPICKNIVLSKKWAEHAEECMAKSRDGASEG